MKKILLAVLLVLSFPALAHAQTYVQSGPTNPPHCNPKAGQLFFNNSTLPGILYYCSATDTWSSSGGANPAGNTPEFQLKNGAVLGAITGFGPDSIASPTVMNVPMSASIKGPAPWTDATQYGVRALASVSTSPATSGITATITSGQNTATISSNSCASQTGGVCFQKGDGVDIYNAGAANTLATPGAPTVAYEDATGPTGTGQGVAAPAGTTTFNYRILACDIGDGCTVAGTAGSTSTGNTLGAQSFAITGMTRSNATITFTVGSQPPLSVGTSVHVDGCSNTDNANGFCGWFKVATVTGTGFTATTGLDTRNGAATTSAGGGTANYWTMNHVTWSAVTGTFRYVIQSDRQNPGTYVNIGMSWPVDPNGSSFPDGTLWFDDLGQTMMANSASPIPWYVPTNGTATNDLLRTTITGISGLTLTLAANAGNSVTSQPILFDDEPTAVAATTAAGSGPVLFPSVGGTYLFNSTTSIASASWMLSQNPRFNDTLAGQTIQLTSPIPSAASATQFQAIPQPKIFAYGNPGILIENAQYGSKIDGLTIYGGANAIAVMQDGGQGSAGVVYNNVQFIGAGTNSDYMSMGFVCRVCQVTFTGSTQLEAGSQAMTDQSFTPAAYLDDFDSIAFSNIMGNARTIAINAAVSGSNLTIGQYHWQGPTEPIITDESVTNYTASITLGFTGKSLIDTGTHAAIFQDSSSTLYVDCGEGGCGAPASSVVAFTGLPVTSIRSYSQVTGQNTNTLAFNQGLANDGTLNPIGGLPINYSNLSLRGGIQVNNSYPIFINGAALAAPTCSVSAGGTVPVGTYTFIYLPVWWNGAEGVQSLPSASCSTTSGNQTITITRGSIPGNPMEWDLYVSNGAGYTVSNTFANPYSMATSSVTWSSHSSFNGGDNPASIPAGGPTMLMPGTQGIVTPIMLTQSLTIGSGAALTSSGNGAFTTTGCSSGSGTVTDSTGTTTANQVAESTTTAHQIQYEATILSSQCPAATSSAIGCTLATNVVDETTSTTSSGSDNGTLYNMNGASLTFTLPASIPASGWMISVQNQNSSALTIALNTHTYNGGSSNLTLQQYQSVTMKSDGTAITGTVPLVAGTNVTLTQAANGQTVAASSGSGTGFNNGAGTGYQDAAEIAAPANPSAGNDRLYLDSTAHQLKCLTSAGASCMPSGGGYATIQNSGTSLTQRTTANVADGLKAVDDSTNSATIVRRLLPADGWFQREDFITDVTVTNGGQPFGITWYTVHNFTGTGGTTANLAPAGTRVGGWIISPTATLNNDMGISAERNFLPPPPVSTTNPLIVHLYINPESVTTNGYFAAGTTSNSTTTFLLTGQSAAWCDVTNTTSAGNWACHTIGQSGSTTNVTLSPAQTATTSPVDIEITEDTTAVTFFFNGTQVGQSTTNLPSIGQTIGFESKTGAADVNNLDLLSWTAGEKN